MKSTKPYRLSRRSGQLASAVPQVVALRVGRMLAAGPLPNARDQREFYRMGAEKVEAFWESWLAMASQGVLAQQRFALWWFQTWWRVALGGWMNPPTVGHLSARAGRHLVDSALDVALRGMAPVHRRAVDNARRLSRPAR
ncbi:polyhydroxyalkanoate granule-associated phasin [Ottowia sp.]|uniref:polyhydroxyalkanoate granule-associated phasin n=1 Tax=Ottowia sp. TaxID=1898956 RepID=UPI0039E632C8